MKKKKQLEDWQIAALHWLLAGVGAPFIFSVVFWHFVKKIAENFGVIVWLAILGEASKFFLIWASIIYSTNYLKKKFAIKNSDNVSGIATIFLCILVLGFRLVFFKRDDLINYIFSYMHLISILVVVPFFYFLSKSHFRKRNN